MTDRKASLEILRNLWPEGKELPAQATPELLGYSATATLPLRDHAELPRGFARMAYNMEVRLSVSAAHTYPGYAPLINTIGLPPMIQFDSDTTAWHALFHEGAHYLHFMRHGHFARYKDAKKRIPDIMFGGWLADWRAQTEVIAELSAYIAMTRVGLKEDPIKTETFVKNWARKRHVSTIEADIEMVLCIVEELIDYYTEATEEST